MIFSEKLQLIRKNKGLTQEELAEKLSVSRQAITKWESGQVYPEITNLIQISRFSNKYEMSPSVLYFMCGKLSHLPARSGYIGLHNTQSKYRRASRAAHGIRTEAPFSLY